MLLASLSRTTREACGAQRQMLLREKGPTSDGCVRAVSCAPQLVLVERSATGSGFVIVKSGGVKSLKWPPAQTAVNDGFTDRRTINLFISSGVAVARLPRHRSWTSAGLRRAF